MPLLVDRSEADMRDEYDALVGAAGRHLESAARLDVEDLALAADMIARAAALAGVLRYIETTNPFRGRVVKPSDPMKWGLTIYGSLAIVAILCIPIAFVTGSTKVVAVAAAAFILACLTVIVSVLADLWVND